MNEDRGAADWLAALAITALALVVRALGLRFGLPWFHHWDEGWITDGAAHMLQTPTWEPRVYQYGAPLPWAIALALRALSALFPDRLFNPNDSALLHLIGRAVTAIVSSSGAFAMYVAARYATVGDRGGRLRAIYASLAYAMAAELVSHGRYAVTDADLTALVAWSLAFGALYVRGGRLVWAIAMVVAAAVAVAFKITAGPAMLVPCFLLVFRRLALPRRARLVALGLAIPLASVVFFALNPNMILHWARAIGDITIRINQYERGGVPEFLVRQIGPEHLAAIFYALTFQVFHRWPLASALLALVAYGGTWRAVRARSLPCIAGVVHATVVVLGLAISSKAFLFRNYLVAVPVLCIGFSFGMEWLHDRLRARARLFPLALAAGFAACFVAVPCAQAAQNEQLATDARMRALDWIVAHQEKPRATLSFTPSVAVDATADRGDIREILRRASLLPYPDVASEADVRRMRPDFVMIVSHPDAPGRGDVWPFESVAGYRDVAHFDSNPWEHNYAITPTWMGRFNVIVLARED